MQTLTNSEFKPFYYPHELKTADSSNRDNVAQFITAVYQQKIGAKSLHFLDHLAYMTDTQHQQICFAFGYSDNRQQYKPFFLEQYLRFPISSVISKQSNSIVTDRQIVEVGNFACLPEEKIADYLFNLFLYLRERDYQWIVCTATRALRFVLIRNKIKSIILQKVDKANLSAELIQQWGRYYDNDPVVIAGNIDECILAMGENRNPPY